MNFNQPPQLIKKEGDPKFSEEARKQLSDFFLKSLKSEQEAVEKNVENIRGIVRDSSIDAFKNLMIFSRAVQSLSENTLIPEKERLALRIHQNNLSPIGAMEILPGANSYVYAIKIVLDILDEFLTKEVSVAMHAYAEKIFLPPAQDYAKHGAEPFDGKLFKPGE